MLWRRRKSNTTSLTVCVRTLAPRTKSLSILFIVSSPGGRRALRAAGATRASL
jgi:hypothetical protein